ncbi:acyltransferase family protein [Neobacillus ginsengisoli]|uniref:Fucose 4-O-acetylase-like acetyltransferase n=1 Tax=Neobacillus ginsengisoli TaxID=904295 RepID=A0ABT9XXF4_9BACI|nr:acyltransferase family protein [Neobacillus ginsengisoli]MDQ0200254.1 fucose 4-O-acetylase-like acetyltransferase [Neobacillus ginsengisoli]
MHKRIDWLDVGKGLGILLVMIGHTNIPAQIKTYIYTFHMPLFFFLSGYLFKLNKFPNLRVFLSKRTKSLIFPYLCFSFVAYIWFVLLYNFGQVDYQHNLLMPLLGSFIATRKSFWTVQSGPLWFVNCILCTEMLFYFISKIGRTKKVIGISLIFISALGCVYNKMVGKPLPWSIDVAMISVGFYGLGFLYKEYREKLERFINFKAFLLLLIINIVTGYLNFVHSGERVDFYNSSLGNIFLFYISALSGIGAFVILIKRMKKYKSLQFIGENSFIYLALHQKIVFVLFNLVIQNTLLNSEKLLGIPIIKGSLYTLLAALIIVPAVYSINHYFPFMLGKSKKRNTRQLLEM